MHLGAFLVAAVTAFLGVACQTEAGDGTTSGTAGGGAASHASASAGSGSEGGQAGQGGSSGSGYEHLEIGTTWQWQLSGTVDTTVLDGYTNDKKMFDIDAFDATSETIAALHAKGIVVVCYVETGDYNEERPDHGAFAPAILGAAIDGFPQERYIDVRQLDAPAGPTGKTLRDVMDARFSMARDKGCDGIEPDLDDLYIYGAQELGFAQPITMDDQLAYNGLLAERAHALGMSIGLKNGLGDSDAISQAFIDGELARGVDWVLNEECNQYDECGPYDAFIAAGKPVFQVEYLDDAGIPSSESCAADNAAHFDGIVKDSSSILAALPLEECH